MKRKHTIDYRDGITTIRFSAAPTYEETAAVIDEIVAGFPYALRLWDFRDIDFDFSIDEIRRIAEYGKGKFTYQNRIAIVAPQDLAYGEMRAFEVYREEPEHSTARVFRTKEEALEWLQQQRAQLPPQP